MASMRSENTRELVAFLVAVGSATLSGLRRLLKRLTAPGTGPFLAGC
jgi:hypothetical protein